MSDEEKESYFDGPHMSTENFQAPCNSGINKSSNTNAESQISYNVNDIVQCSNQPFSTPQEFQPTVPINMMNISQNSMSSNQFNGQSFHSDPATNVPFHHTPNIAPRECLTEMQLLPNESVQIFDNFSERLNIVSDDAKLEENSGFKSEANEEISALNNQNIAGFSHSSQPVGPYMNMDHNSGHPNALLSYNQIIPPVVDHDKTPLNFESIRSDDTQNNAYSVYPGPYTVELHQNDPPNQRDAEDILHSQGTWPTQSYSASSSEPVVYHQQDIVAPEVNAIKVVEEGVPVEFVKEDSTDGEQLIDAINNLAITNDGFHNQVEEFNNEDCSRGSSNARNPGRLDSSSDIDDKAQSMVEEDSTDISLSVYVGDSEELSLHRRIDTSTSNTSITSSVSLHETSQVIPIIEDTKTKTELNFSNLPNITESSIKNEIANSDLNSSEFVAEITDLTNTQKEELQVQNSALGDASSKRLHELTKSPADYLPKVIPAEEFHEEDAVHVSVASSKDDARSIYQQPHSIHPSSASVDTVSMHSSYVNVQSTTGDISAPLYTSTTSSKMDTSNRVLNHESLIVNPNTSQTLRSQMVSGYRDSTCESVAQFPSGETHTNSKPPADFQLSSTVISSSSEFATPSSVIRGCTAELLSNEVADAKLENQIKRTDLTKQQTNYPGKSHQDFQLPPPSTNHVPPQATNYPTENIQGYSTFPQRDSDSNLNRSWHHPYQYERRNDFHRDIPKSQLSVADFGYSRDAHSWYERGEPHGRYRDDWVAPGPYPNSRNYYDNSYNSRYSSDNRHYRAGYYDEFEYDRRYGRDKNRYDRGYDYYRHPHYYERDYSRHDPYYYDRYGRSYGYYDPRVSGNYYQYNYNRRTYDDEDDRRSVYSERSWRGRSHHYPYDSQFSGHKDLNHSQPYYEDSVYTDSYFRNSYHEGMTQQHSKAEEIRRTPAKFNYSHAFSRFSPGGHLMVHLPSLTSERNTSDIKIYSIENLFQNTKESDELLDFPGPLTSNDTHKSDVIGFIRQKSKACAEDTSLPDRWSSQLIWDFMELMVRQNGNVLGSDVADLLMRDHSGDFGLLASPNVSINQAGSSNKIDKETDENLEPLSPANHPGSNELSAVAKFRDLMIYGRKKDALQWAMTSGLWGHALLLASMTDSRTHATVMLRFANSLAINDPLQTLYQLMSNKLPAAVTNVANDGWGDWRPHLAMILSNSFDTPSQHAKLIVTMGDTLLGQGLVEAAHFCYLMATIRPGYYSKKSSKLVLIGSDYRKNFKEFAILDAIQLTEIYEYAVTLATASRVSFPSLQPFKFLHACHLLNCGLVGKAFHYLEEISKIVLSSPSSYNYTFLSDLCEKAEQLKHHDPRIQAGSARDLKWIEKLKVSRDRMLAGSIQPSTRDSYTSSPDIASSHPPTSSRRDSADYDHSEHSNRNHIEKIDDKTDVGDLVNYNLTQDDGHQNTIGIERNYLGAHPLPPPAVIAPPTHVTPPSIPDVSSGLPHVSINPTPQYPPPPPSQANSGVGLVQVIGASQPSFYNPAHFQPNIKFTSTPNSSVAAIPPAQPSQLIPGVTNPPDIYDHLSSVPQPDNFSARMRTESQTSGGSQRSRISRRSAGRRHRTTSERSQRSRSRSTSNEKEDLQPEAKPKEKKGWSLFSWFRTDKSKAHQVFLPDDSKKDIHWDPKLNRWVDANADEQDLAPFKPPPMDLPEAKANAVPAQDGSGPPALTRNKFSLKNLNNRTMYKNPFISSTSQLNSNIMAPPALPSSSVASVFEPSPVPNQNEQPATNFNQTEVIDQLSSSVSHETPKLGAVPLFQSSQPVPMQPYYQPMTISSIANQDPQSTSLHSNPSSTHGTVSLGGGINNALPGSNNFVGPDGISSAPPVGVNNLPPGELYNASGRNPFSRPGGINNEPPGGMNNALRGESTFIHPGGVNEAPGGNPFIRHGGVNNAPHVRVNDAPLGGSTFLQPSGIRNPTPGGNTHHVGEISGAPIANAFVRPGGATDPMILPEYNSTAPPIAQFYNPSQFGGPDIISQPQ